MPKSALSQQIRAARRFAGLDIKGLADRVGVSRQNVSAWENGHYPPSDDNLAKLRKVLGSNFGQMADVASAQLQRFHGRSEELAALSRYLVMRQDELTAELAAAASPYGTDDDRDQPEAAMPTTPKAPVFGAGSPPSPRVRRSQQG